MFVLDSRSGAGPIVFGLDACPWKFVICANAGGSKALSSFGFIGSASTPPLAQSLARAPIMIPSFHLIGGKDNWQKSASLEVKALYDADLTASYTHAFGHELPTELRRDESLKRCLADFLGAFIPAHQGPTAVDAIAATPASLQGASSPSRAVPTNETQSVKGPLPDSEAFELPKKKKNSAAQAARVQRELAGFRRSSTVKL